MAQLSCMGPSLATKVASLGVGPARSFLEIQMLGLDSRRWWNFVQLHTSTSPRPTARFLYRPRELGPTWSQGGDNLPRGSSECLLDRPLPLLSDKEKHRRSSCGTSVSDANEKGERGRHTAEKSNDDDNDDDGDQCPAADLVAAIARAGGSSDITISSAWVLPARVRIF